MELRNATPADAAAIAEVHVRSWQAAYADLLPEPFLKGLSVADRTARWQTILQEQRSTTCVAERAGVVLAFVSFGACRDADAPPTEGEVWALYAAPDAWGHGAGRALLSLALQALHGAGFRDASLRVLRGNRRAIRFYEAAGFAEQVQAGKAVRIGDTVLEEAAYARSLGAV